MKRTESIPDDAIDAALDLYYDQMPVKGPDEIFNLVHDMILTAVAFMEDTHED